MKKSHKVQEWIADRFSFVQYPNIKPADHSTREASRSGFRFKYQMPILDRMFLLLMSTILLLIGLAALFGTCLFIYLFLF